MVEELGIFTGHVGRGTGYILFVEELGIFSEILLKHLLKSYELYYDITNLSQLVRNISAFFLPLNFKSFSHRLLRRLIKLMTIFR